MCRRNRKQQIPFLAAFSFETRLDFFPHSVALQHQQ
jgi:tetratricopeptide (TPR) repeat protein